MSGPKTGRTPWWGPLVALLVFAASLALAEFGLRLVGFEFALLPTQVQFGWPDPKSMQSLYQADPDLLWVKKNYGETLDHARSQPPFDVIFMGDSVTEFGFFPSVLRRLVESEGRGRTLRTLKVGVAGWTSYQGLQQLRRDIAPLRPKYVAILFGWNDHWATFGIEDKDIGKFNLGVPDWWLAVSDLRVAQVVNRALFAGMQRKLAQTGPTPVRVSLDDFRSNLREMTRIAKSNGIVPILLTPASSHVIGEEPEYLTDRWLSDLSQLVPLHERYVEAVREVAREQSGVELIDLYEMIRGFPQQDWHRLIGEDGIHLTAEGSNFVGTAIYRTFLARGLDRVLAP